MTYDELDPRDQAFVNELGAGNKTVVSAQLVSALNGNGNAAIYLAQLLWWSKRKANEEGWFFRKREQMQDRCGLGKQAQRTAEKTLVTLDIIETDRRGMPCKKHFRIHYDQLVSLLSGDEPDPAPTPQAKSQGVGGSTSSGGYVPEQDAGGTCQNPIESNTESNTESKPAREDEPDDGVDHRLQKLRDVAAGNFSKQTLEQHANETGTDWRVGIYQIAHPNQSIPAQTVGEWQIIIDDPAVWADVVKQGWKNQWSTANFQAREDTYKRKVKEDQQPTRTDTQFARGGQTQAGQHHARQV